MSTITAPGLGPATETEDETRDELLYRRMLSIRCFEERLLELFETSSRVADVVLGAFGRALGQGTMNNVTLGNEDVVYYETIGGGQGACPDAPGPSGVDDQR